MKKQPVPDDARVAWNKMLLKLLIGKTVTLDVRDAPWLLQIGSGAVSWHGKATELANTDNPKPKRGKKAVDTK